MDFWSFLISIFFIRMKADSLHGVKRSIRNLGKHPVGDVESQATPEYVN